MELSFKVVDAKDAPLKDVTIKIKNDKESEDLKTDANGQVKAAEKYAAGTKFNVEVSKEGYELVTDVTKGITVDARQSENVFSFQQSIKSVIIISNELFLYYCIYDFLCS